jgi:predicted restriction endonuclease
MKTGIKYTHFENGRYRKRDPEYMRKKNIKGNAISREASKLAGGYKVYRKKSRDERLRIRREAEARVFYEEDNIRQETENEAFLRTIIPPQPYKESTIFKKGRTSKPGKDLKKTYNYTCQVAGCGETEVETAHIRKHSLHDSVDNETNMWCLCCNHHNAFDKSRMIVEDDGSFIRYKQDGTVCEHGFIVYNDSHKVDVTFIRKSREHHVRERQEMD